MRSKMAQIETAIAYLKAQNKMNYAEAAKHFKVNFIMLK